ncbi:DUF4158 domain-containing protein [Microbispora sp. CA-135349]|uniref:DUF4158 domain-containing protein n=1 Tax=Microbispora sp. CA-135349 TaxID=3239953 RepID=UPI003D8E4D68
MAAAQLGGVHRLLLDALLANKSGATRLGFGLMLKFFELEARFPRREDIPRAAVEFMAGQVKVDAELFASYDWSGRTIEYHRAQIRKFHDFREPTVGDEDKLADWLATKICPVEMSRDRLRGALLARCREDRIEPPKTTRIERVLGAAEAMFERNFTATTVQRLSFESVGKLEELIVAEAPRPSSRSPDRTLRKETGNLRSPVAPAAAGARSCKS